MSNQKRAMYANTNTQENMKVNKIQAVVSFINANANAWTIEQRQLRGAIQAIQEALKVRLLDVVISTTSPCARRIGLKDIAKVCEKAILRMHNVSFRRNDTCR